MARLKLDTESLGLSAVMERISHVQVKDCFRNEDSETIYFVVGVGELGKAVGKGGINVHTIQNELGKKVRVIEFRDKVTDFIRNIIYPLTVEEITENEEKVIIIKDSSKKTKGLLIGRDGRNLKLINRAVKRFFNIEEVKVI